MHYLLKSFVRSPHVNTTVLLYMNKDFKQRTNLTKLDIYSLRVNQIELRQISWRNPSREHGIVKQWWCFMCWPSRLFAWQFHRAQNSYPAGWDTSDVNRNVTGTVAVEQCENCRRRLFDFELNVLPPALNDGGSCHAAHQVPSAVCVAADG